MREQFLDVEGIATRCLVAGDDKAPLLILLHGLTLTSEVWIRNIDELGKSFRVVAVDLLGHGFTQPRTAQPVGLEEKLLHLEALVASHGLAGASISGSSFGGLIAANLVLRGRCRIRKLVINGSGSAFNTEDQLAAFMRHIREQYGSSLGTSSPEDWKRRVSASVYDPATIPQELPDALAACYAQPWAVACWKATVDVMQAPERFRPFRILDRLEQLNLPTLVVWGRNDRGGIYESAVTAVKRMPDASLVAFDQCAHLPMLEHPTRYNDTIRDFLAAP